MKYICGCCEGIKRKTPLKIENRPGLSALTYRVGTHSSFMETMLADLSYPYQPKPQCSQEIKTSEQTTGGFSDEKSWISSTLMGLRTRMSDDPAIAFLDAWATVADVLTFYQERIANEGYLRTAIERRSVLELAKLVGYRLRPGVASSVYLAFTVTGDGPTEVPQGARSQSIPATGEMPQTFETSDKIPARTKWSKLKPRTSRPQFISESNANFIETLYFKGISTNLKPNDLLLLPIGRGFPRTVVSIQADMTSSTTKAMLQRTQNPDVMLASMKEAVKRYLDLASWCLDGRNEIVKLAKVVLNDLEESLEKCTSDCVNKAIAKLGNTSSSGTLKDLSDLIQVAGRTRIGDWLESSFDTLNQYADDLGSIAGTASWKMVDPAGIEKTHFRTMMTAYSPPKTQYSPLTSGLSSVLKPLLKAPSLQPSNSNELDRPASRIFGVSSDMSPKIQVAMNLGLGNDLYIAIANARVTEPLKLSSVPVLGTRARPYGHNAPKMPITNVNGIVVDFSDWPLNESIKITVRLKLSKTYFSSFRLKIKKRDRTYEAYGKYGKIPQELDLGDGIKSSIKMGTPHDVDISIAFNDPDSSINIKVTKKSDEMDVDVDGETFKISDGNEFSRAKDSHRVEVSFDDDILLISDELFLKTAKMNELYLDAKYDSIIPGSWVVIKRPDVADPSTIEADPRIFRTKCVRDVSRNDYGFSGETTKIDLEGDWLESADLDISVLRGTEVYAQSGSLDLADEPIDPVHEPVCGDTIELDGIYDGLETGRWLIISGERLDVDGTSGVTGNELVMIAGVSQDVEKVYDPISKGMIDRPGDTNHTFIKLANSLAYVYKRDTLTIYGNVSKATQGETKSEVLGSGDASKSFQSFTMHQSPLTYVPAPNQTGIDSTLQVRINDILWKEVDNLAKTGPKDRVYVTEIDDDSKTKITFGNGVKGARPSTGTENIRASYRAGMGSSGNVQAGQISQLMTRPPGVTDVVNPIRAFGGADREGLEQARSNTPLALMALDRLISVQDYADFSRTFAGIGKAVAKQIQSNRKNIVYVTIAGVEDIPIDKGSDLYRNLVKALHELGDIGTTVMVEMRDLVLLLIKAHIKMIDGYLWESVELNVRAALHDAFGFDRRDLDRRVLQSEVISIIQGVEGVAYVDLDILEGLSGDKTPEDLENFLLGLKEDTLPKEFVGDKGLMPAQLVILSSSPSLEDTLILQEVKP